MEFGNYLGHNDSVFGTEICAVLSVTVTLSRQQIDQRN